MKQEQRDVVAPWPLIQVMHFVTGFGFKKIPRKIVFGIHVTKTTQGLRARKRLESPLPIPRRTERELNTAESFSHAIV